MTQPDAGESPDVLRDEITRVIGSVLLWNKIVPDSVKASELVEATRSAADAILALPEIAALAGRTQGEPDVWLELMRQWHLSHAEHCGEFVPPWPHDGICKYPMPNILSRLTYSQIHSLISSALGNDEGEIAPPPQRIEMRGNVLHVTAAPATPTGPVEPGVLLTGCMIKIRATPSPLPVVDGKVTFERYLIVPLELPEAEILEVLRFSRRRQEPFSGYYDTRAVEVTEDAAPAGPEDAMVCERGHRHQPSQWGCPTCENENELGDTQPAVPQQPTTCAHCGAGPGSFTICGKCWQRALPQQPAREEG